MQHRLYRKQKQAYPTVSVREIEYWHPDSVYKSLLDYADWITQLDISPLARRLTRLHGHAFYRAVNALVTPVA